MPEIAYENRQKIVTHTRLKEVRDMDVYEKQKRTRRPIRKCPTSRNQAATPAPRTIEQFDDAWEDELTVLDETEVVDASETELDTEEYDDELI